MKVKKNCSQWIMREWYVYYGKSYRTKKNELNNQKDAEKQSKNIIYLFIFFVIQTPEITIGEPSTRLVWGNVGDLYK